MYVCLCLVLVHEQQQQPPPLLSNKKFLPLFNLTHLNLGRRSVVVVRSSSSSSGIGMDGGWTVVVVGAFVGGGQSGLLVVGSSRGRLIQYFLTYPRGSLPRRPRFRFAIPDLVTTTTFGIIVLGC